MQIERDVVRGTTDADAVAWNNFLDAVPYSSPLARYEWRRILEQSYGVATHFFLAERDGRVSGVLGAYATRMFFGCDSLYSLRCGLVAQDAGAARALLNGIAQRRHSNRWQTALVSSGWQTLSGIEPSLIQCTLQLPIAGDQQSMWRALKDKTRNMIRRAEKRGVETTSGLDNVDILVDHYHANMLRLGVPIHSRAFFHRVVEALGPQTEILVAWYDGKPIASMLIHFARDVACYPYQNTLFAYRDVAAIQILNWAAMKRCAERGVKILDMGESRVDSPVFRSKVNFGGTVRDVYYYLPIAPEKRESSGVSRYLRGAAGVADNWLASRTPAPLRRYFAQRRLTRGRLV